MSFPRIPLNTSLTRAAKEGHQKIDTSAASPEMRKAAQGLEAIFTGEMMKAMRGTVETSEFSLHNSATDIYQGMLDEEYAETAARMNSLGLSEQILDYWLRSQPNPQYTKPRETGQNVAHHSKELNSQEPSSNNIRTGGTDEDQSSK